jgi:hypothetical protein
VLEEQDPTPMLDYRTPEAPRRDVSRWRLSAGVLISVVSIGLAVPLSMSLGFALHSDVLPWATMAGLVVGLNALAILARRHPARRAYAQGLWIGMGIAVLLEGACFLTMMG